MATPRTLLFALLLALAVPALTYTVLTGKCAIPPNYLSLPVSDKFGSLYSIRVVGQSGENTYSPNKISAVEVTQKGQNIVDFILYFEVYSGSSQKSRVGTWLFTGRRGPATNLLDCGGPTEGVYNSSGATITNNHFIDKILVNDFKLLWLAPSESVGTLILRGVFTTKTKGATRAYRLAKVIRPVHEEILPSTSLDVETEPTETSKEDNPRKQKLSLENSNQVTTPIPTAFRPAFDKPIGDCGNANGFPASPQTIPLWVNTFKVPPVAKPTVLAEPRCDSQGRCFTFYEINVTKISVNLFGKNQPRTSFYAYGQNGVFSVPGPTFKACVGEQVIVRFRNNITNDDGTSRTISVHLHGSASFAPYDGWADDTTSTLQYKDYVYPANRAAPAWYHDHAFFITTENVLRGLYGFFQVDDCCRNYTGLLPHPTYDLPLIISDAVFDALNQVYVDKGGDHKNIYAGDHQFINGVPWPLLRAEPRVYRFRGLVGGGARVYDLSFVDVMEKEVPFYVIGTDGGFLEKPVRLFRTLKSVAERFEVILDLRPYAGQTLYLKNNFPVFDFPQFCQSHLLLKITVDLPRNTNIREVTWTTATQFTSTFLFPGGRKPYEAVIPMNVRTFAAGLPWDKYDRSVKFVRQGGQWKVDVNPPIQQIIKAGLAGPLSWEETFNLPRPHVLANPETNRIEIWELENGAGGWVHPVHLHLVDMVIVAREDVPKLDPTEVNAAKDLVFLGPGARARVVVRFGPHSGSYMMHCHNLIHEDDDMLVAFEAQRDHSVMRLVNSARFPNENILSVPISPVNSTNFTTSLRNPMLGSARAKSEKPLPNPIELLRREKTNAIYSVFYPKLRTTPPLGANPANPWEVNYACKCV